MLKNKIMLQHVINRDGQSVEVKFDKITSRLRQLCEMEPKLSHRVNYVAVAQQTIAALSDNINTSEIDRISADICNNMKLEHPDYDYLGARLVVSDLHKSTVNSFSAACEIVNDRIGIFRKDYLELIRANAAALDDIIDHSRDFMPTYIGIITIMRSYLQRVTNGNNKPEYVDRPQYMYMRVALAVNIANPGPRALTDDELEVIRGTYNGLSLGLYTHASPTMLNACCVGQLGSCFLSGVHDSKDGLFRSFSNVAGISKYAGGVAIHVSSIRSRGSKIHSNNSVSSGVCSQIKIYNEIARCYNQGRRAGSFVIYLEPWHADIKEYLELRLNAGDEALRARNLFYALWIPDLFVRKMMNEEDWHLFNPDTAPYLADVYDGMRICKKCGFCRNRNYMCYHTAADMRGGASSEWIEAAFSKYCADHDAACDHEFEQRDVFTELYNKYVAEKRYTEVLPATQISAMINQLQMQTGMPYCTYKDAVNRRNSQENVGTIKSSNLCVAGDTPILTINGYKNIDSLEGQFVEVWNGVSYSAVQVMKTADDEPLYRVMLSGGLYVDCTAKHRFLLENGKTVITRELKAGARLMPPTYPREINDLSDIIKEMFSNFMVRRNRRPGCATIVCNSYRVARSLVLFLSQCGVMSYIALQGAEVIIERPQYEILQSLCPNYFPELIGDLHSRFDAFVVQSVIHLGSAETFCFHEPGREMGIFGGILTKNCTEIVQWSSDYSYACCTLASLNLPKFVRVAGDTTGEARREVDHAALHAAVRDLVRRLDVVVDINSYPCGECSDNALKYRSIGIGVQGLANMFAALHLPFVSEAATRVDLEVFETIYHAAITESATLAKYKGAYFEYEHSPAARGELQFDLWLRDLKRSGEYAFMFEGTGLSRPSNIFSGRYDWNATKAYIRECGGLRNAHLIALMPTATTSLVFENVECFEPFNAVMFTRTNNSGKNITIIPQIIEDLIGRGLWSPDLRNKIIENHGSVTGVNEVPKDLQDIYKTMWEMKQIDLMRRSALRGAFIDQSQSFNVRLKTISPQILRGLMVAAYRLGVKVGSYYIHAMPATTVINARQMQPQKKKTESADSVEPSEPQVCKLGCTSCSL